MGDTGLGGGDERLPALPALLMLMAESDRDPADKNDPAIDGGREDVRRLTGWKRGF